MNEGNISVKSDGEDMGSNFTFTFKVQDSIKESKPKRPARLDSNQDNKTTGADRAKQTVPKNAIMEEATQPTPSKNDKKEERAELITVENEKQPNIGMLQPVSADQLIEEGLKQVEGEGEGESLCGDEAELSELEAEITFRK